MCEPPIETVTITLAKFKAMESEIERLKKENGEKTIYKTIDYTAYSAIFFCAIFVIFLVLNHFVK